MNENLCAAFLGIVVVHRAREDREDDFDACQHMRNVS